MAPSSLTTSILRRRRLDRSATIYGIIGTSLLVGAAFQWIRFGKIRIIEEFARQLGFTSFLMIFQIIAVSILSLVMLRGILAVLRTRLETSGEITFNHDGIEIKKGKLAFNLSGDSLQKFSILLPDQIDAQAKKPKGGCQINIPSPDGTFNCEFELSDTAQLAELQHILQHMETVHSIEISKLKK